MPASIDGKTKKEKDKFKQQFESLCSIQCTEEEICAVLDCDEISLISWCKRTYGKTFSQVFKEKRLGGRASLRRNQYLLSEKNATMAIWLGKQYLGQTDKTDIDLKADIPSDGLFAALQQGLIDFKDEEDDD